MMKNENTYNITELAALGGVSPRTVRYYVQLGILPPPAGRGLGGRYGQEHLARLLRARALQREGVPLERMTELMEAPQDKLMMCELPRAPADEVATPRHQVLTRVEVADGVWLEFAAGAGAPAGPRLERIVRMLRESLGIPSGDDDDAHRRRDGR
jgi:DNA-binding transcriptional MerR regulator